MIETVFKIAAVQDWERARETGTFAGSADDLRDGFIHLSTAAQIPGTLDRHFKRVHDLVLIAFRADALSPSLRWEKSRGGELFPHLYAPLPASAAAWWRPIACDANGNPHVDEAELTC